MERLFAGAADLAAQYPALRLIPLLALALMAVEWLYARLALHDVETYDLRETAASLAIAIGNQIIRPLTAGLTAVPLFLAWDYRLFDIPTRALGLATLFVLVDFAAYWHHRAAHRIRFLWATHAVHHSATRFNLSCAIRLGWTGAFSGVIFFYLPIVLIGFHPLAVLGMVGLNLVYQFVLHTEHVPPLGPVEWVMNTPTHHKVHHASNAGCLDRNYGGVFIVWDRLFGTFARAPEDEALRYGLVGEDGPSRNPLVIQFREWLRLARDVTRAPGLRARLRALFGAP
ncbi:sterol desaturase family protein [Bosea sp. 117]|uniref:sterol desaturase family protein n=1 Tax=Bosea sp. 117 TaxID=1125973 RepID=UPI0004942DF0|nr:sterol desaturase family protein [Bosea sp. 117]